MGSRLCFVVVGKDIADSGSPCVGTVFPAVLLGNYHLASTSSKDIKSHVRENDKCDNSHRSKNKNKEDGLGHDHHSGVRGDRGRRIHAHDSSMPCSLGVHSLPFEGYTPVRYRSNGYLHERVIIS